MSAIRDRQEVWLSDPNNVQQILPEEITLSGLIEVGGQGAVFQGAYRDTPAAIKVYFPGQLSTRVAREVDALCSIQCPTIVRLLWSGRVPFQSYSLPVMATDYISGKSLKARLEEGPLAEQELRVLAKDVTAAIDSMWSKHIVHRDLKPGNILARTSGRFCVIDLGLARHLARSSLTAMGATWGTIGYLSPEQTRATRQLTCKSDIYALGVILVEAAIGRHPTSYDQDRLLRRCLHESLPGPLAEMELAPLVQAMLQPRPMKRPMPEEVLRMIANSKE